MNVGIRSSGGLLLKYNDEGGCPADVVARAARRGRVEGSAALYAAIFDFRNCVCRPEAAYKVSLRLIPPDMTCVSL